MEKTFSITPVSSSLANSYTMMSFLKYVLLSQYTNRILHPQENFSILESKSGRHRFCNGTARRIRYDGEKVSISASLPPKIYGYSKQDHAWSLQLSDNTPCGVLRLTVHHQRFHPPPGPPSISTV